MYIPLGEVKSLGGGPRIRRPGFQAVPSTNSLLTLSNSFSFSGPVFPCLSVT